MKIIDRLIDRLAVRTAEEIAARQAPPVVNVTNHHVDRYAELPGTALPLLTGPALRLINNLAGQSLPNRGGE